MAFTTQAGSGANDVTNSSGTFTGTSGVDNIVFANSDGNILLGGQGGDDTVNFVNSGSALYNGVLSSATLNLGKGADQVTAGANATVFSNLQYNGDEGNDTLTLGVNAADTVVGGALKGGAGDDTLLTGGVTSALVNGNAGDDTITVNRASNLSTVMGGQGNDTVSITGALTGVLMNGNKGNDRITSTGGIAAGTTTIHGGQGDDILDLSTINDTSSGTLILNGDKGADNLTAATVATVLNGGEGVDGMTGGAGNDTFTGGAGADNINVVAIGGSDDVVFEATTDFGDVITGFTTGTDQVNLAATDLQSTGTGFTGAAAGASNFGTTGFIAIDANTALASATMTTAAVAASGLTGFTNVDANESAYFAFSTDFNNANMNVFVYRAIADGAGTALSSSEFVTQLNATELDNVVAQDFVLR